MATKKLDTSITDTQARRFLDEAGERDTLWCDKVTGLHLIKLKKGGSWRYRYQDTLGKRHVATVGRYPAMKPQQAAERALAWRHEGADVLADKARERQEAAQAAALAEHRTLRAYLEGPYQRYQDRKRAGGETLAIIKNNFRDYLDRDMASLTRADIREWQQTREAEGRAHTTLKRAFGALKTMLRHATRQDPPLLEEIPLERVTLEAPTDTERAETLSAERAEERRPLTPEEIQGLHDGLAALAEERRAERRSSRAHGKPHLPDLDGVAYPHWFVPFAYCSLYTGLRPGDVYSLTWTELNLTFGRLVKVPQKTRHHPDPAKITLDLPEAPLAIMREWWKQQGKPDKGLVFPSPVTGRQLDKQAHSRPWARVKRLGGLPEELKFYSLRHHFISTLVTHGVPLLTVAKLAGHKSVAMIESHYGHLCPTTARDAIAAFGETVTRRQSG